MPKQKIAILPMLISNPTFEAQLPKNVLVNPVEGFQTPAPQGALGQWNKLQQAATCIFEASVSESFVSASPAEKRFVEATKWAAMDFVRSHRLRKDYGYSSYAKVRRHSLPELPKNAANSCNLIPSNRHSSVSLPPKLQYGSDLPLSTCGENDCRVSWPI